ncbi:MAG: hypothetical protein GXP25_11885 [Planctomycetes bacterium]|nr:hypothetical protein [Planctomycetota bacterium]
MRIVFCLAVLSCLFIVAQITADEKVGERPYEMVWANRTKPDHPPLVDFENLGGWRVETKDAVATITRSREQQLWGKYVGKLVYRGTSRRAELTVRPPKPIPIPAPFDCVNFWVYGNNWAWRQDLTTPRVGIHILLQAKDGKELQISLGSVRWKEWWVMHKKLQPEQLAVLKDGASFAGIRVTNCHNEKDRVLYFDNLAFYREALKPLTFVPRPKRGIDLFPGQDPGVYTGKGRLPFPTREQTILPDNLTQKFRTSLTKEGNAYVFRYKGNDGELEYRYEPKTGTLSDVTAKWGGWLARRFQPMADGGVYFAEDDKAVPPDRFDLLGCERVGDTVIALWRVGLGQRTMDVTYTFRLWQKSLVVDVKCPGGQVGEFVIGRAVGVDNPRLVTIPYLVGAKDRPAVLVTGKPDKPLFVTALMDYYRSNASALTFVNRTAKDGVTYNGGAVYTPKTDGKRNDCFERLFLTVSPCFEEILPNIPNPKSPWMHVAGERLWRAHGASNRERDYDYWKGVARYGMTKVVITDHETGWRDGGESFTFRTKTAPKKGGDASQKEYSRKLHALGFRYGIYNNYTDFAPVNGHWDEDMVNRRSNGDWQTAWARCYAPKPTRAVEYEAKLTPIIQEKFKLSTAYCDVHTAVTPWGREDYDARVPGAGTFIAQFYPYGEIMLHQKRVWNGPVYSEGNNHYYYCGLTDGNYGQDQKYRPAKNPWLVDFDLRKMHPLCCNFGMGNPGMFYGRHEGMGSGRAEQERKLDRFLAATIAFGHTGFLVRAGGIRNTVRSYYLLQQLHKNYAEETATDIRYANKKGDLLDTSSAVATGAYKRSQIATTYSNGLRVWVNGHTKDTWKIPDAELPPNGYFAKSADGKLVVFSAIKDGHRADYCQSPAYDYCDGRGVFTRFPKAASDAAVIALKRTDGKVEVIPVGTPRSFGVSLEGKGATAIALDKEYKELGPVETRLSRGLVYVMPKEGAFSYLLTPVAPPAVTLKCNRVRVVPGEAVKVTGKQAHDFRIPPDAKRGQQLWQQFEGAWIDFTVLPVVDATLTLDDAYHLTLTSNLPVQARGTAVLDGKERAVDLAPGETKAVTLPFTAPDKECVREIKLKLTLGEFAVEKSWWLRSEEAVREIAALSEEFESGQCLRKGKETCLIPANRSNVHERRGMTCGNQTKNGIFMHPPYMGGVGYSFALFKPIPLPLEPKGVFRCFIGKGDGSDPGDGILFRVAVVDEKAKETIIAEKQWIKHAWTPLMGDLSPWAGKTVRIKLITDVGPADNSSGDWACWAAFKIETKTPVLVTTLHDHPVRLAYEPGPHPVPGLTLDQVCKAKRGWFHYEEQGLQCSGSYISKAEINGVVIGNLPSGEGASETKNVWSKIATVELPAEVIRSLKPRNALKILNPGKDCFKIRGFWVELELADGRKCSSRIATTVFTQPPNWLYAEGVGVPNGDPIESEIVFDVKP